MLEFKWKSVYEDISICSNNLIEFFVGIGIDKLSVSAPYALKLREKYWRLSLKR